MSIASAVAAEIANEKRAEWLLDLEKALRLRKWPLVYALAQRMREFEFSE